MSRSRSNSDSDSDFDAVSTVSNATTNARADTIFTWWACRRLEQSANTNSNAKEEMAAN